MVLEKQKICKQGSSLTLTFSALGGRGKEKNLLKPAEKIFVHARARRKEGVGEFRRAQAEAKPRRPARKVEGRAEQKNCLFLLEEFFGGARKSEIVKAIFLRGVPSHGTAAGRSELVSFKMGSDFVI